MLPTVECRYPLEKSHKVFWHLCCQVVIPVVNLDLSGHLERSGDPLQRVNGGRRPVEMHRRITLASLHSLHGYNVRYCSSQSPLMYIFSNNKTGSQSSLSSWSGINKASDIFSQDLDSYVKQVGSQSPLSSSSGINENPEYFSDDLDNNNKTGTARVLYRLDQALMKLLTISARTIAKIWTITTWSRSREENWT